MDKDKNLVKKEQSPEDIIKASPYKENALIEEQSRIVEALVKTWNTIITEYENKTILFALRVKELCRGYPDKTISELIEKVRNHPDLKQPAHSKDRIMQGLRLVNERPDLIDWEQHKSKIYLKKDGTPFWEFYFQLYKYSIDPGFRFELEEKGKAENWSCRRLQSEIIKLLEEKRDPYDVRRFKKRDLIKEIVIMIKELEPADMEKIKEFIIKNYDPKLVVYKQWKAKGVEE
jgi:hypothetical protein